MKRFDYRLNEHTGRNTIPHLFKHLLNDVRGNPVFSGYPMDTSTHTKINIHEKINFKGMFPIGWFTLNGGSTCNIKRHESDL